MHEINTSHGWNIPSPMCMEQQKYDSCVPLRKTGRNDGLKPYITKKQHILQWGLNVGSCNTVFVCSSCKAKGITAILPLQIQLISLGLNSSICGTTESSHFIYRNVFSRWAEISERRKWKGEYTEQGSSVCAVHHCSVCRLWELTFLVPHVYNMRWQFKW